MSDCSNKVPSGTYAGEVEDNSRQRYLDKLDLEAVISKNETRIKQVIYIEQ